MVWSGLANKWGLCEIKMATGLDHLEETRGESRTDSDNVTGVS